MAREKMYSVSRINVDLGQHYQNVVPYAQEVAILRGIQVAETLFDIASIRSLHSNEAKIKNASVTCEKAHVQDVGATDGHQAAHLVPGQIMVRSKPVWEFAALTGNRQPGELASEVYRLRERTRVGFANTTILPALFNRADSEAEKGVAASGIPGLKSLFGTVAKNLWSRAQVDTSRPLAIDRIAVLNALEEWFRNVNMVYQVAAAQKNSTANMSTSSSTRMNRSLEATVLTAYADSFKIANPARFVAANLPFVHGRYGFLR